MKYIDRRFLFPVAAVTAWAQQPSPASPEVEAALRARVEQYYQLQVDRKFRQAESMVAEDSKDDYYNRAKQDIKGFSIKQIEWLDNNRARVTIAGKVVLKAPLIGAQEFEMPLLTSWKVENGQWVWYVDRDLAGRTPFGKIAVNPSVDTAKGAAAPSAAGIDPATLLNQVTLDSTSVTLNASNPVQTVTVTNHLPGPITLELRKPQLDGVSIEVEKSDLKAGEKIAIRFSLTGEAKSSGVVRLVASPLNQEFEIQVHSN
jgi:hypothetical protein